MKFKLLYIKFDYYDTGIAAVNSLRLWNIMNWFYLLFVLYTADLCRWSPNIVCIPTYMGMIRRFMAGVNRLMSACSKITYHGASTTCGGGCAATGYSWMHWDGVHLVRSCMPSSSHSWSRCPSRAQLCSSVQSARDLGVYLDSGMMMRAHINHMLWSCYGTLRQFRSIKRSLPSHALNTLITSLVHSRLDYCNVVFAGLPACDVQQLQWAVRLVTGSPRRDHVTSLLCNCHWLPVKQRVEYKLCTIVHRCLYSDAPSYLVDLIKPFPAASARAGLKCCWVDDRRSATHPLITWRPLFCDRQSACVQQATITTPSDAVRWHF